MPHDLRVYGRRISLCGGTWSLAPDWRRWLWAYTLTTFTAICVILLTRDTWTFAFAVSAVALIALNQCTSYLLLLTDPGVFPRQCRALLSQSSPPSPAAAAEHTADDIAAGLKPPFSPHYCSRCLHDRPPRTSHCYTCDVCVVEHDHHCFVLGICIGRRNMRWFVLYLLSTVLQLFVGLGVTVRSFQRLPLEGDWKQLPPPEGVSTWTLEAAEAFDNRATLQLLSHLSTIGLIGVLIIPVSIGCMVYIALPMTNTTWREARQNGLRRCVASSSASSWHCRLKQGIGLMVASLLHMACVGPSLLHEAERTNSEIAEPLQACD